jgi:NhaP-type Na+/H+ or K+/H+ antiporter
MDCQALTVVAAFAFAYSLVSSRLQRTVVSGALVYVSAGFLCGPDGFGLIDIRIEGEGLKTLVELTLALVLFADSARTNLKLLPRIESISARLLLIGLPLTIALGFGLGYLLFDKLELFELALLATMLAPTDAALGKAVVTNKTVPESIRGSLSLESGLNDGICVPVRLFFLAMAVGETDVNAVAGLAIALPLQAIGIGVLVGAISGTLGSLALMFCSRRQWISGTWLQTPVFGLALFCFAAAQFLGGSGFIACFIAGLVFGGLCKKHKKDDLAAAEAGGDLMAMVTWFVTGAAAIGLSWGFLDWKIVVYSIASLTLVRMVPVFLCLSGMKLATDTKLFIGWFGPRGLASVVFVVMVMDERLPGSDFLLPAVICTILMSIVLHGLTANPFGRWLGARVKIREEKIQDGLRQPAINAK